jgi:hypothetical protein
VFKTFMIALCLVVLICNSIYRTPIKLEMIIRAKNEINSCVLGYGTSTIFKTNINKLTKEDKENFKSDSVNVFGTYYIIDYSKLILISLLIVSIFTALYFFCLFVFTVKNKQNR